MEHVRFHFKTALVLSFLVLLVYYVVYGYFPFLSLTGENAISIAKSAIAGFIVLLIYAVFRFSKMSYCVLNNRVTQEISSIEKAKTRRIYIGNWPPLNLVNRAIYDDISLLNQWCRENKDQFINYWNSKKAKPTVGSDYRQYVGARVKDDDGNERETNHLLFELIKNSYSQSAAKHIQIFGPGSIGKTALAHQVVDYLHTANGLKNVVICVPLVQARPFKDEDEVIGVILNFILKRVKERVPNAEISLDFIEQLILNGNVVLVADDADKIFSNDLSYNRLLNRAGSKPLYLTTSRRDVQNLNPFTPSHSESFRVQPLNFDEALALGRRFFSQSALDKSITIEDEHLFDLESVLRKWMEMQKESGGVTPGYLEFVCAELFAQFRASKGLTKFFSLANSSTIIEKWVSRLSDGRAPEVADDKAVEILKIIGFLAIKDNLLNSGVTQEKFNIELKTLDFENLDIKQFAEDYPVLKELSDDGSLIEIRSDFEAEHLASIYISDLISTDNVLGRDLFLTLIERYRRYCEVDMEEATSIKDNFFRKLASHLKKISPTNLTNDLLDFFIEINEPILPRGGRPINLLFVSSLSGDNAIRERSLYDAMMLAIQEVNDDPRFKDQHTYLNVPYPPDIGSDIDTALQLLRKSRQLKEYPIVGIFGCYMSDLRESLQESIQNSNIMIWYPATYEGYAATDNIVFLGGAPNQQIIPAVEWSLDKFSCNSKVGLFGSDYVFSQRANQLLKKVLSSDDNNRCEIVYEDLTPLDFHYTIDDFSYKLEAAVSNGVEWIFHTMNGRNNVNFFKALNQVNSNLARKIKVMTVTIAESTIQHIGAELLEGHYCCWNYFRGNKSSESDRAFEENLREKYLGTVIPDDPVVSAYMSIKVFANAVLEAKDLSSESINIALKGLNAIDGPGGPWQICENMHFEKTPFIGKFSKEGAVVVVDSFPTREPKSQPLTLCS